jgi:hypothetical protein
MLICVLPEKQKLGLRTFGIFLGMHLRRIFTFTPLCIRAAVKDFTYKLYLFA